MVDFNLSHSARISLTLFLPPIFTFLLFLPSVGRKKTLEFGILEFHFEINGKVLAFVRVCVCVCVCATVWHRFLIYIPFGKEGEKTPKKAILVSILRHQKKKFLFRIFLYKPSFFLFPTLVSFLPEKMFHLLRVYFA